jgi:hypothetical protein
MLACSRLGGSIGVRGMISGGSLRDADSNASRNKVSMGLACELAARMLEGLPLGHQNAERDLAGDSL